MSNTTYSDTSNYAEDVDEPDYLEGTDDYYDDAAALEEPQEGLFSSPARALMLGAAVLMLLLLTGAIAWLLGSQSHKAAAPVQASSNALKEAAKVGFLAPDFTLTEANTGKLVHLASLRGKPVWLNFWATWCHACVEEMPDMKKAYAQYKDKGLVILGVDDDEPRDDVNNFTKSNGYDWTFLLDPGGAVIDSYLVDAIPTHWFVGKDGVLKAVQIGSVPASEIQRYLAKILE